MDEFVQAPERSPDRYGPRVRQNRTKCSQLAADFFKDSVRRARERNLRSVSLDENWLGTANGETR